MFNLKKILIIILFIAIVLGIGYAIYAVFFKSAETPTPPAGTPTEETTAPPAGGLPSAIEMTPGKKPEIPVANGGAIEIPAIESDPSLGATMSDQDEINYYNTLDGKFYKIDENGNITTLSEKVFYNVINVVWSPDATQAILEYPDGSNILYNFDTSKQTTLPQHWQEFDFSADGTKIAAKSMGMDADNRWLIIADPDGTNSQIIEHLGSNAGKVQIKWSPSGQIVAFAKNPENLGLMSQEILFLGLKGENFKSITAPGLNFEGAWSPDGSKILYSVASRASNYEPMLWIIDADLDNMGANRRSLGINSWAKKCIFADSNTLYCAIPTVLPRGAGLQPDLADNTNDSIWKINLTSGQRTVVATPSTSMSIFSLSLSRDKNSLYFVDRNTNTVRKMRLK